MNFKFNIHPWNYIIRAGSVPWWRETLRRSGPTLFCRWQRSSPQLLKVTENRFHCFFKFNYSPFHISRHSVYMYTEWRYEIIKRAIKQAIPPSSVIWVVRLHYLCPRPGLVPSCRMNKPPSLSGISSQVHHLCPRPGLATVRVDHPPPSPQWYE